MEIKVLFSNLFIVTKSHKARLSSVCCVDVDDLELPIPFCLPSAGIKGYVHHACFYAVLEPELRVLYMLGSYSSK